MRNVPAFRTILAVTLLLLTAPIAAAHAGEQSFNETEEMIASQTPCSDLTEDQLAQIGDYYMEQMHPGEMHEIMDEHMGGEGSESLRQVHLNMADRFYCDSLTARTAQNPGWMPMAGEGMWHGGGWIGFLFSLGLFVLAVLGVISLYRHISNRRDGDD